MTDNPAPTPGDWKPGRGQAIERLYAWVCEEPDGGEGVIAMKTPAGWMPLVGADRERMESLWAYAQEVASRTGLVVRLKVFGYTTVQETLRG